MIIHHWDTDGIASAAIFIKKRGEDKLFTPKIGNFFLDEGDFHTVAKSERINILDMNLPDAGRLCEHAEVYIYDHHRAERVDCAKEHYNPYLRGEHYPSCTTVLMERFEYPPDYLVALGVVGDLGPKAKELKRWDILKTMEKKGITYDMLKRAAELLDSSFKLMKRDEVVENVHLVLQGLDAILSAEHLQKNVEKINAEIDNWVSKAELRGHYYFLKMRSPYQLISAITRKLAWELGKPAIVVNEKEDRDEFYIRSPDANFNALPLIDMAKTMGYRAGGKREVMGAILPKGEGDKLAQKVLEVLKW
ncbi:MAG: hypothetical protein GXO25_08275 [Euryarchaeota archaeon]|nr:hypothetical protein [Euryarchaeota archaeon]